VADRIAIIEEDIDPEGWHVRETFAYYGRAMYAASCLEVGIAHIFMDGVFIRQQTELYRAVGEKGFDRKAHEAAFDAFMDEHFSLTFGNLLKRVNRSPYFSDYLRKRLAMAKEQRDFLAHSFWRERSIEFTTEAGRAKLIEELDADAHMFQGLDRELDPIGVELRRQNGIDEERFQAWLKRYMDRAKSGEITA
jgi:hypothetical protein